MDELIRYLPFLLPVFAIQVGLAIFALVDILKHETYRRGSRVLWILVVLLFSIIGPILYFTVGKGES